MSDNVGVERTFPINSPNIESIEVHKVGKCVEQNYFILENVKVNQLVSKKKELDNYIYPSYLKKLSTMDGFFLPTIF